MTLAEGTSNNPTGALQTDPSHTDPRWGQQVRRSAAVFSPLIWLLGQGGKMALILEGSRLELSSGVPAGCGFILCF